MECPCFGAARSARSSRFYETASIALEISAGDRRRRFRPLSGLVCSIQFSNFSSEKKVEERTKPVTDCARSDAE